MHSYRRLWSDVFRQLGCRVGRPVMGKSDTTLHIAPNGSKISVVSQWQTKKVLNMYNTFN